LGGEPLHPNNQPGLQYLLENIKYKVPGVNIWLWTGYDVLEQDFSNILDYVNVVVDGPFDKDKMDGYHPWRGSWNQRIFRQDKYNKTW